MLFQTSLPRFVDQEDFEDLNRRIEHVNALTDYTVNR
jgi:hypothetical protein